MITKEEQAKIASKFFNDPDWALVEQIIHEYIDPLSNVATIDTTQGNDAVATEVRGRQIAYENLTKFLRDCRILGRQTNNTKINFK